MNDGHVTELGFLKLGHVTFREKTAVEKLEYGRMHNLYLSLEYERMQDLYLHGWTYILDLCLYIFFKVEVVPELRSKPT